MFLKYIELYFDEIIYLLNEMSPYLLLGFLFAGIFHIFLSSAKVNRIMGKKNTKSVINATLFGIPLPLCSCGVIPTGISFYKNGASKGGTLSFLISTPQTGVDSIMVTYSLLGLPFAIIRPLVALFTGIFGGLLSNFTEKNAEEKTEIYTTEEETSTFMQKITKMFRYAFVDFLQDISKWLIIGIALAGFIALIIPDNFFTTYIGNDLVGMMILLVASIPLYVCATGSVPIAAVLMMKGLSPGAALVFLMAGPATNAATMTVIGKVLGRKSLFVYLGVITGGAFLFGYLINTVLPQQWFTYFMIPGLHTGHEKHILPTWLSYGSSAVLILLIINGYFQKYKTKIFSRLEKPLVKTEAMKTTIKVNGMECNHCKLNVEKNLKTIKGIKSVKADIINEMVEIEGDEFNISEIEEKIKDIGYTFGGEVA